MLDFVWRVSPSSYWLRMSWTLSEGKHAKNSKASLILNMRNFWICRYSRCPNQCPSYLAVCPVLHDDDTHRESFFPSAGSGSMHDGGRRTDHVRVSAATPMSRCTRHNSRVSRCMARGKRYKKCSTRQHKLLPVLPVCLT